MPSWAIELIKAALVVGGFGYLIRSGQLRFEDLTGVGDRWPWLLAAQVPFGLLLLVAALRWHLLLRAQSVEIPFRDTFSIMLIGWFFNQTMPSSTGGDVAKAAAIALEHPNRRTAGIMSIFVDRFTGLLTLLVFALALSVLASDLVLESTLLSSIWIGIAVLFLSAISATALFYSTRFRARIGSWLRRLGLHPDHMNAAPEGSHEPISRRIARVLVQIDAAVFAYRHHGRTIALCFAASLVLHTLTVSLNLLLTWIVLGSSFDWLAVMVIVPMVHIGMAVPLTPGSIGVGEWIYTELFATIGIMQGTAIGLLQRLVWWTWAAVGATVFLVRRKTGRTRIADSQDMEGAIQPSKPSSP